jgi:hypothetical protein
VGGFLKFLATTLPYRHHSPHRARAVFEPAMFSFGGYLGGTTRHPPCCPHSAPILPQLLSGLRAPSPAPAWGSGLALPGFGRAMANDGEGSSSHASTAITRRQYRATYIEHARLVRQCLARAGSTPRRHDAPAPRPQGVPLPTQGMSPLRAPSPTPAWDTCQRVASSGDVLPKLATPHVGAADPVQTQGLLSLDSPSLTAA